jgi:hypothetical protein
VLLTSQGTDPRRVEPYICGAGGLTNLEVSSQPEGMLPLEPKFDDRSSIS